MTVYQTGEIVRQRNRNKLLSSILQYAKITGRTEPDLK